MTTMERTAETGKAAAARYNGVAVWDGTTDQKQVARYVGQAERLELLEERDDGWLHVRLEDGTLGFVRREAARPGHANESASHRSTPAGQPNAASESPLFPGAGRVATGLTAFAWITVLLSQIIGIAAAASYHCTSAFGSSSFGTSCSDESSTKIVFYAMFAVAGLFMALLMWAAAYGVLLLDRIERNTGAGRGRG